MSPGEYIPILEKGLVVWNDWRLRFPYLDVDLSGYDLREFELSKDFRDPRFDDAETTIRISRGIDLSNTKLASANFEQADLSGAQFRGADLAGAKFSGATLWRVNFEGADLRLADFTNARVDSVSWGNCDLRGAVGLEFVRQSFPSSIDVRAIRRADLPASFLVGLGLPADLREYLPAILDGAAVAKYSCFISYCTSDEQFVERLHADLQSANIRTWYAPAQMRAGDLIRKRLDEAIALSEKLLVILSTAAVSSQYVEQEVEAALEKERLQHRLVLIPVMVDRAVFETSSGWPSYVRRTRHIADFTAWRNWTSYRGSLERLIRDVKQTTLAALSRDDLSAG